MTVVIVGFCFSLILTLEPLEVKLALIEIISDE